jgi:hypothetical protein
MVIVPGERIPGSPAASRAVGQGRAAGTGMRASHRVPPRPGGNDPAMAGSRKAARRWPRPSGAGPVLHRRRSSARARPGAHAPGPARRRGPGNHPGFSRQTLTRLAADYGIEVREGPQDYKRKGVIDRDWLLEQYVNRGRTLPDPAREKNMSAANMSRWAHHQQIRLRPRGGGSHDSSLRSVDQAARLPGPIAKALTSPYAWQRLKRFAAVVGYQTLSEAAEHRGIKQPTLVTQISRLERGIGGPLLERAERRRP